MVMIWIKLVFYAEEKGELFVKGKKRKRVVVPFPFRRLHCPAATPGEGDCVGSRDPQLT
jgi:hypothetical protein